MVKTVFKEVLCLLVLTVGMSLAGVEQKNLIANGDFESLDGENLKSWHIYASPGEPPLASAAGAFMNGRISARLKSSRSSDTDGAKKITSIISDKVADIVPGTEYRLSFYARSPVAGQPFDALFYAGVDVLPHYWKMKSFILGSNWTKYVFIQKLPPKDEWGSRSLFIRFDIPYGEAFIDDVVLEPNDTPKNDSNAAVQAVGRKNLLINSGFELEWQGWGTADCARPLLGNDAMPTFDGNAGQSGSFALKMTPRNCLRSQSYPLEPGQKYTLSFYAKASPYIEGKEPKLGVLLITPVWQYKEIELVNGKNISSEWKRYSFSFVPKDQGTAFRNTFYVRIDAYDITAWLDSFQLEKGEMTDYDPGMQIGFINNTPLGLFTVGVEANVDLVICSPHGIAKQLTLSLAARDAHAKTLWSSDIQLEATNEERIIRRIKIPTDVLGVVELSAKLEKDNIVTAAKCRYCVISGEAAKTRPNPLFGVEASFMGTPCWLDRVNESVTNAAGAEFSRFFYWHSRTAPSGLDADMLSLLKKKTQIKKSSGKTTMIAIDVPGDSLLQPDNRLDEPVTEELLVAELKKFGDYAAQIATTLRSDVDYYQLLNEPNIWWNRNNNSKLKGVRLMPPERYIRFVEAGSKAIRAVLPEAKIAANVNCVDMPYTQKLFELGLAKYIDAYTVHAYRQGPETPPIYDDLRHLRALIDNYAKDMPVFNDEQYFSARNCPLASGTEDNQDYYSDTEQELSGKMLQTYLHCIAGAKVPFNLFNPPAGLFAFGLSNPVYYYFSFGGYRYMSQTLIDITSGANVELHHSVRCFLFERKDGSKVVSLNTKMFGVSGGVGNIKPDGGAFDMNGNKLQGQELPVDYLPIYLIFKPGMPVDAVMDKLRLADFNGFDTPLNVSFEAQDGTLFMNVANSTNKEVDATISFKGMPDGWDTPPPVSLLKFPPHGSKRISFPVSERKLSWKNDYSISYQTVCADSFVSSVFRLPVIFAEGPERINIDGDDSEWNGAEEYFLGEDNLSTDFSGGKIPHKGTDDLSATLKLAWDADNIYLLVKVSDDVVFHGTTGDNSDKSYNFDSVQVYFDMRSGGGKEYDGNVATYSIGVGKDGRPFAWLDKSPTGRYIGVFNATSGIDNDVRLSYKRTGNGYIFKMAFPHSTLPYLNLKDGSCFGFSVLVNDNDGTGRKQGVTLGPKGTEPHRNPYLWKTVKLVRKP